MLLDPRRTWSVANRIDAVLAALPPGIAAHASAETHACVIELRTAPHPTVAATGAELALLRRALDEALRDTLGLRAAAAGTHPTATPSEVALSAGARYRHIGATMGALAHREPTMAQHVHVAVPDATSAVRALNGLRSDLPLVLALSANSPFWRGGDSGFASIRTPIFSMFPRVGIPRRFRRYEEYVSVIDAMLSAGAIPEPGFLWWDARVRPRLGTIEIRIMDAQSRASDAAALTALVQWLVHGWAHGRRASDIGLEMLAENRFSRCARRRAQLIDDRGRARRPALDALRKLLDDCRAVATRAGLLVRAGASRSACARSGRRAATSSCQARRPGCASRPGLPESSCPRLSSRRRPEGCRRARVRSASPAPRSPP